MDIKNIINHGTKITDSETSKKKIKKILIKIVSENNLQYEDTNLIIISNFIIRHFFIKIEEIHMAFNLFFAGSLDIPSHNVQSTLTVKLIGIVLNSYSKYRQNILKDVKNYYEQSNNLTDEEIKYFITDPWINNHVIPFWINFKNTNDGSLYKDYGSALWDYLYSNNILKELLPDLKDYQNINFRPEKFDYLISDIQKQLEINQIFIHCKKNNIDFENMILQTL